MVLIPPFAIGIEQFVVAVFGEEHTTCVHFFKHEAEVFFGIAFLTVAVCNKIVDEVFFGFIPALSFPTATSEVVHKIEEDGLGVLIGEATEE